jgi:hypothetical protein
MNRKESRHRRHHPHQRARMAWRTATAGLQLFAIVSLLRQLGHHRARIAAMLGGEELLRAAHDRHAHHH